MVRRLRRTQKERTNIKKPRITLGRTIEANERTFGKLQWVKGEQKTLEISISKEQDAQQKAVLEQKLRILEQAETNLKGKIDKRSAGKVERMGIFERIRTWQTAGREKRISTTKLRISELEKTKLENIKMNEEERSKVKKEIEKFKKELEAKNIKIY